MVTELEKKLAGIIPWNGGSPANYRHDIRPNWVDLSLNYNSLPYNKEFAIIVTSWNGHLPFLKATLTSYRLSGGFVICAYDFPFGAFDSNIPELVIPTPDIWLAAHSWVFKHKTYDNNKREGWFWDIKYAAGILSQFDHFKYIFTVNGDCIWENPRGVRDLAEVLGDGDLMSISSERETIHTCAMIWKPEAFYEVLKSMSEFHKVPVIGSLSPEVVMTRIIRDMGLKETFAPQQPMEPGIDSVDHYSRYNQSSTWKEKVGYRNLGAEYMTCAVERKEPVPKKYMDLRYKHHLATQGQSLLANYYESGDRRWLMMLWDQNEISWYDRVFYSLEHYGENPIIGE